MIEGRSASYSFVRDETANCASWIYESANTFVLGCGRSLRFFDLRLPKGEVNLIRTPTVLLACDPLEDTRIATYSGERGDLTYKIWDWRIHSKSSTSHSSTPLQKCWVPGAHTHSLQWSPTRRGVLSALVSPAAHSESSAIYTWSVPSNTEQEEFEQVMKQENDSVSSSPSASSDNLSSYKSSSARNASGAIGSVMLHRIAGQRVDLGDDITCYHLHPSNAGGLLAVSAEESLKEYTLHQGGALAFLPDGSLFCGKSYMHLNMYIYR